MTSFIDLDSKATVLEAYQPRLMGELQQICDAIPHDQLSIQWETVFELLILDGHPAWKHHGNDATKDFREHFAMVINAVPDDVEMGVHFCYGDAGHKHFKEPDDMSTMVRVAKEMFEDASRSIDFIHMPVPKERDDVAYFTPLEDLHLPGDTEFYLGCIHETGGMQGIEKRINTAKQFIDRCGVATECGFGRRKLETIPDLLKSHVKIVEKHS